MPMISFIKGLQTPLRSSFFFFPLPMSAVIYKPQLYQRAPSPCSHILSVLVAFTKSLFISPLHRALLLLRSKSFPNHREFLVCSLKWRDEKVCKQTNSRAVGDVQRNGLVLTDNTSWESFHKQWKKMALSWYIFKSQRESTYVIYANIS